ncbi:hypothetical protein JCM8547_006385 [Rhodosporidiobolus lusitaniae]
MATPEQPARGVSPAPAPLQDNFKAATPARPPGVVDADLAGLAHLKDEQMERKEEKPHELHAFPSPFDQNGVDENGYSDESPQHLEPPVSLHEILMHALSYSIRRKPGWERKYKDPEIRAKWRKEALAMEMPVPVKASEEGEGAGEEENTTAAPTRLTEKMVDYVLVELELHERDLKDENGIRASCYAKIYESDRLLPSDLLSSLVEHISHLEANPPFGEPDWHPGSNEQVLDLLHPSLFPLRYGVTPVKDIAEDGSVKESTTNAPAPRNAVHSTSKKYQWLPSDFDVDADGKVSISSYINNLHPTDYATFYPILASIFERFVPLFERVLSELQLPSPHKIPINWETANSWYGEEEYEGDEDADDYWDKWEEFNEKRELRIPQPDKFVMPQEGRKEPVFSLKGRKLQVITKIASIHLTPDKPNYDGGVWHVEGMQNEEIVASGLYYYAQENIKDSQLAFRGTFDSLEVPYEQNDERGVKAVFGIENEGPCVQYYNALDTTLGRCIAFPNIYQHRVSPFSLIDPSKPGFRKILVFFLVDPLKSAAGEVISTARVPYQQKEWVAREIGKQPERVSGRFPPELWDKMLEGTEGLMSYEEAKVVREDLMKERKFLIGQNNEVIFEREFSLCEH